MHDRVEIAPNERAESFIAKWRESSGAERANFPLFASKLCDLLGVSEPDAASEYTHLNDYVFERSVRFKEPDGTTSVGRIDLYKRGCFVFEAKQSRLKDRPKAVPGQNDLFVADVRDEDRGRAAANRAWDVLMINARRQAEDYAKALPASHGWPPFILVGDVGHCIEVYADFSGQGKNYAQFPDRQGYRIYLNDLRKDDIRERLRLIWTDPHSLDPARKSATVTREIAKRLADASKALEARGNPSEQVAEFLMRCLFTMFAEDVKLLPEGCFQAWLEKAKGNPDKFRHELHQLWQAMDKGGYATIAERKVKCFNGRFFQNAQVLDLQREEIGELLAAAGANWKEVDPAIFGTLLEQALDPAERRKLGAHYTPRAYVERLVVATIIEPLRADWAKVEAATERLKAEKKHAEALKLVREFHDKLCATRVLDPACGTGNFLYVALELMKRLEGDVLEAVLNLGGEEALTGLEGHTVGPSQFLGLEINPRAAAIAELVVWLGYLQWHFRTKGGAPGEPILRDFGNIKVMDAVLTWDGWPAPQVAARPQPSLRGSKSRSNPAEANESGLLRSARNDEKNEPAPSVVARPSPTLRNVPRRDRGTQEQPGRADMGGPVDPPIESGESHVTETVAPVSTRIEVFPNARRPDWPDAEFIVGNPPFLGGKDIRSEHGAYAEALWKVHKHINESADYVMYWWDRAAEIALRKGSKLRRFGLVTTNSITQVFSRRVVAAHLCEVGRKSAPQIWSSSPGLSRGSTASGRASGKAVDGRDQPGHDGNRGGISIVMAIPDHPWTKATQDAAAVRIAMTVAEAGRRSGVLRKVVEEEGLDTDQPEIEFDTCIGRINADLTVGVDVTSVAELRANEGLCSPGVKLHGSGFIVTPREAEQLGLGRRVGLEKHIRAYRNGRDLTARPRGVMVIDLFGLSVEDVRKQFPEVYQRLLQTVKAQREEQAQRSNTRDAQEYLARWWTLGKPRQELRPALAHLRRYIATVETATHRVFQFLDASILPDNMIVAIALDDAFHLGILSSRIHVAWALHAGGTLEDRPRYSKSRCFDPFPFPDCSDELKAGIREVAEEIDAHRKARQAEHPRLTLTQMYNLLEKLRAMDGLAPPGPAGHPPLAGRDGTARGETQSSQGTRTSLPKGEGGRPLGRPGGDSSPNELLTPAEENIKQQGLILILKELHEKLDALVARAYGWPTNLADEEILARLVALNRERAEEEKSGHVRWLRPDYQIPRFGSDVEKARVAHEKAAREKPQAAMEFDAEAAGKPTFPTDPVEETACIMSMLASAAVPLSAADIARGFAQGQKAAPRIVKTLEALARLGHIASSGDGRCYALRTAA